MLKKEPCLFFFSLTMIKPVIMRAVEVVQSSARSPSAHDPACAACPFSHNGKYQS